MYKRFSSIDSRLHGFLLIQQPGIALVFDLGLDGHQLFVNSVILFLIVVMVVVTIVLLGILENQESK